MELNPFPAIRDSGCMSEADSCTVFQSNCLRRQTEATGFGWTDLQRNERHAVSSDIVAPRSFSQ